MNEENKTKDLMQQPQTYEELVANFEAFQKGKGRNGMLNRNPPSNWVEELPEKVTGIKGIKFLPVDKHEYLLKTLFQKYKIEVISYSTMFNAVTCHVRVHYYDPILEEWLFQDGVGAVQVQTKAGTSVTDLINITSGAVMRNLPHAKSLAKKDACEEIANIFGSNLNRKDTIGFEIAQQTKDKLTPEEKKKELEEIEEGLQLCNDEKDLNMYFKQLTDNKIMTPEIRLMFSNRKKQL